MLEDLTGIKVTDKVDLTAQVYQNGSHHHARRGDEGTIYPYP